MLPSRGQISAKLPPGPDASEAPTDLRPDDRHSRQSRGFQRTDARAVRAGRDVRHRSQSVSPVGVLFIESWRTNRLRPGFSEKATDRKTDGRSYYSENRCHRTTGFTQLKIERLCCWLIFGLDPYWMFAVLLRLLFPRCLISVSQVRGKRSI